MLKPQDFIVLLRIVSSDAPLLQQDIASDVGMSQAEVSFSLRRSEFSNLYDSHEKRVRTANLLEVLNHGLKYFFPAEFKGQGRGIKTAWAAEPLISALNADPTASPPVWSHPNGDTLGQILVPIYPTVPEVALRNADLYQILALVESLRMGRLREREIALAELSKRISR